MTGLDADPGSIRTDIMPAEARSRLMARIGGRNTKPEVTLRKALFRLGFRYRLHPRHMPGRPDMVFPRWRGVRSWLFLARPRLPPVQMAEGQRGILAGQDQRQRGTGSTDASGTRHPGLAGSDRLGVRPSRPAPVACRDDRANRGELDYRGEIPP